MNATAERVAVRPGGARTALEVACVIGITALITLPSHFTRDLWNPDEPRYMEVAREMVEGHDYVVLHLNGEPYEQKPPLFFWLTAAFYRMGAGYDAGRAVSALATAGILLIVYFFGRQLLGGAGGLLSALATATLFLFASMSKLGVLDPLLTFFTTLAIVSGYEALTRPRRAGLWWLVFYAACGLGILTKGPVAIALSGVVVGSYALVTRKRVKGHVWGHAAGVALMVAVVCAWFVPVWIQGGSGYAMHLLRQAPGRLVHSWSHRNPPYYYIVQLPVYFFPWFLFVGLAVWQAVVDWRRQRSMQGAFAAVWFLSILVLLSAVSGKRARYILPLFPAAGMLAAWYFVSAERSGLRRPRLHKWFAVATFCLLALVGLALIPALLMAPGFVSKAFPTDLATQARARALVNPGTLLVAGSAAAVMLALSLWGILSAVRARNPMRVAVVLVVTTLAASLFHDVVYSPMMNPFKSGRFFCERAKPYLEKAEHRYIYPKAYSGVYNLYSGYLSMPVLDDEKALGEALRSAEPVAVISRDRDIEQCSGSLPPGAHIVVTRRVGHRNMVLVANGPLVALCGGRGSAAGLPGAGQDSNPPAGPK